MLIKCPECHREISNQAISCPHCGYPLKQVKKPVAEPTKKVVSDLLIVAARGGAGGFQIALYILAGILLLMGVTCEIVAIVLLVASRFSNGFAYALVIFGEIFQGVSVFMLIYLSVFLKKNNRIKHDLVYYSRSKKEFICYSILDQEIRIPRDTSFLLRDNKRNLGELIVRENGKKLVRLGFTPDNIELIKRRVEKCRSE